MNREFDMSPYAQGLTPLRTIAVRAVVMSELSELGLLPAGSERLIEKRKKMLHEWGEVERMKAIGRDELAGEAHSLRGLNSRIKALESELAQLRAALFNRAAETPQPKPKSQGRRPRWLGRFLRGRA